MFKLFHKFDTRVLWILHITLAQLTRILHSLDTTPWGEIVRQHDIKTYSAPLSELYLNLSTDERREFYCLTPVAKLSDDVLGHIFLLLVTINHGYAIPTKKSQSADLISKDSVRFLSQVFHHWQTTALGLPMLWNNVDVGEYNTPTWNKELIRRSHLVPLNIRSFKTSILVQLVKDFSISSRIQMLAMWYCGVDGWDLISNWLQLPATQLEVVSFNYPPIRKQLPP